jgi:hypothetical protein
MKTYIVGAIAALGCMTAQVCLADLIPSTELVFFGAQLEGTMSPQQNLVITNNGTETLTNLTFSLASDAFIITNCPAQLVPTETCDIGISFRPDRPGKFVKKLVVDAEGPSGSYSAVIRLEGSTAR